MSEAAAPPLKGWTSRTVMASSTPRRQCSVEIQNKCSFFTLCNPLVHNISGFCEHPLPPSLGPSESGKALFVKSPHAARGAVGVFTYDVFDGAMHRGKVAIMFSVPYDFNLYSNWYGVGVFGQERTCDQQLYDLMYNKAERGFVRGKAKGPGLTHRAGGITLRATMSDSYQPVIKFEVSNN